MNMFMRTKEAFAAKREDALAALRRARFVACDETGVRIEAVNAYQWVFCCEAAIVHSAQFTRGAIAVREAMAGHRPQSVDVGPLYGPAGPRRPAADMPRPSRPRDPLRRGEQRRQRRLSSQALAGSR